MYEHLAGWLAFAPVQEEEEGRELGAGLSPAAWGWLGVGFAVGGFVIDWQQAEMPKQNSAN